MVNLEHRQILRSQRDGDYVEDRKLEEHQEESVTRLPDNNVSVDNIQRHCLKRFGYTCTSFEKQTGKETHKGIDSGGAKVGDAGFQYAVITDSHERKVRVPLMQSSRMRFIFQTYPHLLYIDDTYAVNTYNYPYVFLVVDGDNIGHVIGYALVKDETSLTLSRLITEFMMKSEVRDFKTIVVDADHSEIEATRLNMPQCNIDLCRLHIQQALNNAIATKCHKDDKEGVKRL
ncbi:hypothetical protein RRG08_066780 [Elysia crispata]|uniref:ZSWIM1/3 RNaseH-like domain-containing protein n=1 Tax=Elysia crispata TaxID=231223 RepID=A0AAE1CJT4_9GAST|nr:hypothetical protein RRG08_066780 [Elysia crispata]